MSDVAIGQLLWAIYGALLGALGALAWAGYRGWFDRKVEVKAIAAVHWEDVQLGIQAAIAQGLKDNRPHTHITVDWSFIHSCIEGEGYMLVMKPKDADNVARKN